MKIVIAGDHYTVELMGKIQSWLEAKSIEFSNVGTNSVDKKISLQEIIPAVVKEVRSERAEWGVLVCGTGVGVEIGANRFPGIRASLCRDAVQAKNARIYDSANVLCLGSWYKDDFEKILNAWLENEFDNDEHRTQMIKDFDEFADK